MQHIIYFVLWLILVMGHVRGAPILRSHRSPETGLKFISIYFGSQWGIYEHRLCAASPLLPQPRNKAKFIII